MTRLPGMEKAKFGDSFRNLLIIVMFLVLALNLLPTRQGSRLGPWRYAQCRASMRVLMAAMELYNQEQPVPLKGLYVLDMAFQSKYLSSFGYLQTLALCPKGLVPAPTAVALKIDNWCFSLGLSDDTGLEILRRLGYKPVPTPGVFSVRNFPEKPEICCSVHGPLPAD